MPNYNNSKKRKQSAPKPVSRTVRIYTTGEDRYGNKFSYESLISLLTELQEANVFAKLSVSVTTKKSNCTGNENDTGYMSIARVQSFDPVTTDISISFFGKGIEYHTLADYMVIVPRVRIARGTDKVESILGFELCDPATM